MPPDARRAGEDHMVEGELRESDADVGIASEHRHFAFVEIAGHQPRHQRRDMFGEFARLDHRAVPRREPARHRDADHAYGEVQWGYAADEALRLALTSDLRAAPNGRAQRRERGGS